ncbi:MAG: acylglycerol kinase family protein, partial [Planctomycetota bacterium]
MRSDPDGTIRQHAQLIVNPAAGGGRSRRAAAKLETFLRAADFPYERADTTGPGHARALAAASAGLVIVAGGDGTVNEV